VSSRLHHPSFVKDMDDVGVHGGCDAMRNHEPGSAYGEGSETI
jgi:hypothetical protein